MPASKLLDLIALLFDFISFWLFVPAFVGVEHLQMVEKQFERFLRSISRFFLLHLPNLSFRGISVLTSSVTALWALVIDKLDEMKIISIPAGILYRISFAIAPLILAVLLLIIIKVSRILGNNAMSSLAILSVDGPRGEEVRLRWARLGALLFLVGFVLSVFSRMLEN